jgi:hypothetical protein
MTTIATTAAATNNFSFLTAISTQLSGVGRRPEQLVPSTTGICRVTDGALKCAATKAVRLRPRRLSSRAALVEKLPRRAYFAAAVSSGCF